MAIWVEEGGKSSSKFDLNRGPMPHMWWRITADSQWQVHHIIRRVDAVLTLEPYSGKQARTVLRGGDSVIQHCYPIDLTLLYTM